MLSMRVNQARKQGGEAPLKNFPPLWKNLLDIL